jgi:hypothetical protein
MPTYEKYTLNLGPYQEGNLADIELDMDESFPMAAVSVTFQVRDSGDRLLIEKTSDDGDIVITGQNIVIPLPASEMAKRNGTHNYEIDFINSDGDPFATIGGTFKIGKETNR